ncbi:unnamed protein product [Rhodiola kirilowii]
MTSIFVFASRSPVRTSPRIPNDQFTTPEVNLQILDSLQH